MLHAMRALLYALTSGHGGQRLPGAGAACSPFRSIPPNDFEMEDISMTIINLKRYYPYITEDVTLEVSDEIAAEDADKGRVCHSINKEENTI